MLKKIFVIGFLFTLGTIGVRAQEEEINPVKWSLSMKNTLKSLNKGDVFNADLKAEIGSVPTNGGKVPQDSISTALQICGLLFACSEPCE